MDQIIDFFYVSLSWQNQNQAENNLMQAIEDTVFDGSCLPIREQGAIQVT